MAAMPQVERFVMKARRSDSDCLGSGLGSSLGSNSSNHQIFQNFTDQYR